MPNPTAITWCGAGGPGDKVGKAVPMTPALGAAIAAAWAPAPAPAPTPVPVTPPAPGAGDPAPAPAPTPPPTPATPPQAALPALKRIVCPDPDDPGKAQCGLQFVGAGDVLVENTHVEGFAQNLVVQKARSLTLRNFRSARAYRRNPPDKYEGNAAYVRDVSGRVTVSGYYANWNGWQPGKTATNLTEFRHDWYGDFNAAGYDFADAIFAHACNAGCQLRAPGTIRRAVFLDCATALLAVMGGWSLEGVTIYDGHYHNTLAEGTPGNWRVDSWTAHAALSYCYPGQVRDVWIVGRPNQGAALAASLAPGVKCYPQGAVVGSRVWGGAAGHPEYKPSPSPVRLDARDCLVSGWPGATFAGTRAHDGTGFRVLPGTVDYDYEPVLAAVEANQVSIAEAVRRLTDGIRGLVA